MAPGKTFMRQLFELLARIQQVHHHILPNAAFRSDLLMVGHLSGHLEWGDSDADFAPAAGTSCVDRCLWSFRLWGSVPDFSLLGAAVMASSSYTGKGCISRKRATCCSNFCSSFLLVPCGFIALPFLYSGALQLLSAGSACLRGPKWLG